MTATFQELAAEAPIPRQWVSVSNRGIPLVMPHRSPASKDYCQSLLCVQVPLVVTLARTRMVVDNVLKLVPGVMIPFDKSCESPLTLEVGDKQIAEGEVVKVGDKFGLRISSILPAAERFIPLHTDPSSSGSPSV